MQAGSCGPHTSVRRALSSAPGRTRGGCLNGSWPAAACRATRSSSQADRAAAACGFEREELKAVPVRRRSRLRLGDDGRGQSVLCGSVKTIPQSSVQASPHLWSGDVLERSHGSSFCLSRHKGLELVGWSWRCLRLALRVRDIRPSCLGLSDGLWLGQARHRTVGGDFPNDKVAEPAPRDESKEDVSVLDPLRGYERRCVARVVPQTCASGWH